MEDLIMASLSAIPQQGTTRCRMNEMMSTGTFSRPFDGAQDEEREDTGGEQPSADR